MMFPPTEKELDLALADALTNSAEFLQWFLSHTKFRNRSAAFISCRSDHPWGAHPFPIKDPVTDSIVETRRQSETDVLLIVRALNGEILGVHIENKIGSGKFTTHQPEMYSYRARHWIDNTHYGGYKDFDTVLLAPASFKDRNADQAKHFGCFTSHEEIGDKIPVFDGNRDA
jgi:hypothetical protein